MFRVSDTAAWRGHCAVCVCVAAELETRLFLFQSQAETLCQPCWSVSLTEFPLTVSLSSLLQQEALAFIPLPL